MAIVAFNKLSQHDAVIKGINTIVWRVRITGSVDEYFVRADRAHSKLGGGYWTDTKHLIALDKVTVPEAFQAKEYDRPLPSRHQDIICGQCGTINTLNIDMVLKENMQGTHACNNKRCNVTICIIVGNRINLKNGSKAGNTTLK